MKLPLTHHLTQHRPLSQRLAHHKCTMAAAAVSLTISCGVDYTLTQHTACLDFTKDNNLALQSA